MNYKMNANDCYGRPVPPSSIPINIPMKETDRKYHPRALPKAGSFVCCPDLQTVPVSNTDSEKIVRVNLKECAAKLWNNLFGNISDDFSFYCGNASEDCADDCNYGCKSGGDDVFNRREVRSYSEMSRNDYRRMNRMKSEVNRSTKMREALKCCMQEKIARPKICESFLIELQQMLARYPYTNMHFYWDILKSIQAEIDEHRCKSISKNEYEDKKLKQLFMLSYAVTRYVLQLEFITGGNSMFRFKRAKSWSQILNQFKDDFKNPKIPKMNSFNGDQDELDESSLCSCLPLGFFSRALNKSTSDAASPCCITLKTDCFPDEFTCFDLESLNHLFDNLKSDFQLECSKGLSGKCQVVNCPYPVPIRDERVIKELKANMRVIEQLICFLRKMTCFKTGFTPTPYNSPQIKKAVNYPPVTRSKSILKNKGPLKEKTSHGLGNLNPKCPQIPKNMQTIQCNVQTSFKNNLPIPENSANSQLICSDSPKLRVTRASPPKINESTSVNLCCPEQRRERLTRKKSRTRHREQRSRSGTSGSLSCSDDDCSKKNKSSKPVLSCRLCKERRERRERRERKEKRKRRSSQSDKECELSFCDANSCKEESKKCKAKSSAVVCEDKKSKTSLDASQDKEADKLLVICQGDNDEMKETCEGKSNLMSSISKLLGYGLEKPPSKCESSKLVDRYKAQKCLEKLRKSSKSNVQPNDCKHKKERIIRLVNLLSNNDCSLTPTDPCSASNSNNIEGVCNLYDKFLALEDEENAKKCEILLAEELKCALLNAANEKCCNKSVGTQASKDPSKQSIGCNPINPTKICVGSCVCCPKGSKSCSNVSLKQLMNTVCSKQNLNCPSRCDVTSKSSRLIKLPSSRSVECLKQKLECKFKALTEQQQKIYCKEMKALEKKICKNNCKKCHSDRSMKAALGIKTMDVARNRAKVCVSKCSLKKCRSKSHVKCCKSKSCKRRKDPKKAKSCATDIFCFIDKADECCDEKKSCCKRKKPCCSPKCKTRKKSKSKTRKIKKYCKPKRTDSKSKCCVKKRSSCSNTDAQLRETASKLKKSCSKLKKYKCELDRVHSKLVECDQAKQKLEKCASILIEKLTDAADKDKDC